MAMWQSGIYLEKVLGTKMCSDANNHILAGGGGWVKDLWGGIPVVSKGSWERNTDVEMRNSLLKLNEL